MRGNGVRASEEAQAALVGAEPGTFFVQDTWRATAPKRVIKAYDAADAG